MAIDVTPDVASSFSRVDYRRHSRRGGWRLKSKIIGGERRAKCAMLQILNLAIIEAMAILAGRGMLAH